MATGDLSAWLGRTVFFNGLDPDDVGRLAAIAREVTLQPNDVLFEQGDELDGLYVIAAGIIRVYLTAEDGREATINLLEDGEVIGEMSLLDGLAAERRRGGSDHDQAHLHPARTVHAASRHLDQARPPDHPDALRAAARRQRAGRPGDLP